MRRNNSSVFPENMEPQTTSIQPLLRLLSALLSKNIFFDGIKKNYCIFERCFVTQIYKNLLILMIYSMNSFEQNTTNRKKLTQIIDNLTFINDNVTVITALERDVILQNLREAYTIVLQFDLNEDVKSEEKIVK